MAVKKKSKGTKSSSKGSENKRPKNLQTDFSGVEGRKRRRRIKEGDYLFKVSDYEVGKSGKKDDDGKKKRFIVFEFEILKGPSTGTFSDLFGLAKNQLWRYRNFLEAVGVKVSAGVTDVRLDKIPGKQVAGTVEDDEYNGKIKSQVSDYFAASEYEELDADEEDEDEDSDDEDEDEDEDEEDTDLTEETDEDEDEELETVDDDDI